jgi:hypothetical protein
MLVCSDVLFEPYAYLFLMPTSFSKHGRPATDDR